MFVDPLIHSKNRVESLNRTVNNTSHGDKNRSSATAVVVQSKRFDKAYLGQRIAISDWKYG